MKMLKTTFNEMNIRQESQDLRKLILEGVCTKICHNNKEIYQLCSLLLFSPKNQEEIDLAIQNLIESSFVFIEDGVLKCSQLGKATMVSSLPPDAALSIFDDLNTATRSIALDTELHMLYLVTPINVSVWQECDWHHLFEIFNRIPAEHRRVAKLVGVSEKFIVKQINGSRDNHFEKMIQIHKRFFCSLALLDLINESTIYEVSVKYRISRGCLQTFQSQSATYAAMIVAFCVRLGWTYLKSLLDGFALRLMFGVRSELSELVSIDGIDGQRARILHEKGITCLSHLSTCDDAKLGQYLTLAVPYSRENANDGKGEWLSGEPRLNLEEAVKILKERANRILLSKLRDLGVSIEIRKPMLVDIKKNQESCDSGFGETCQDDLIDNEKSSEMDLTQSMDELSLVENTERHDEDLIFEELETTLSKLPAPCNSLKLQKRLSAMFTPVNSPRNLNDQQAEDSFDLPIPGSMVLRMHYNGVPFDSEACTSALCELRKHAEQLEEECWNLAHHRFCLESSQQIADVLFRRLGLIYPDSSVSKVKKHLSTSKAVLELIVDQHPIVEKILKYRHINHTITSCLIPIFNAMERTRIRCSFELCTATGRILTDSPNLQNVPKSESIDGLRVRSLFAASSGCILIGADYCQLELRVLAHMSNDTNLITMISSDRDVFQHLAEKWEFQRDAVKQLCYGLIYGMGVKSLSELTRLKVEQAEILYNNFFTMFPKVRSFINQTKEEAFKLGYVQTVLGRKRVTNRSCVDEEKCREERILVNFVIQGTASEIFKNAVVEIDSKLRDLNAHLILTIHDEVLFCIRNFICDHTDEVPGPMDPPIQGRRNTKSPVFHIYGVTDTGKRACLHVHGVLPYIVLRVGGKCTNAILIGMRNKINKIVQREIDAAKGLSSTFVADYVYKLEVFSSRPIYGYHEEEEDFVKVFFTSSWISSKATAGLGKEIHQNSIFQPYEAHIPFYLQFYIDNSIFGMDNIYVENVKFRIALESPDDLEIYNGLKNGDIKNNIEVFSPYCRSSYCLIECDVMAEDILNKQLHANNVHSSNPGLEHIWREEKERCDAQNIELVDVFNSYEPRKCKMFAQEREMLKTARNLARRLRVARNMSETLDALMETRIAESQSPSLDATIWESPENQDRVFEATNEPIDEQEIDEVQDDDEKESDDELEMTQVIRNPDSISDQPNDNDEKKSGLCILTEEDTLTNSQFAGKTQLLSQTSIDEGSQSEVQGESDICGLCVASLELLIATNKSMPDVSVDPILSASLCIFEDVCRKSTPDFHKILSSEPSKDPRVVYCGSEQFVIERITAELIRADVDVLIGFDITRLSWGYFMMRAKYLGLNTLIILNRFKPDFPNDPEKLEAPKGRLYVAVWKAVRADLTLRSYDLGTVVTNLLHRKIPILSNATLVKKYMLNNERSDSEIVTYLLKLSRVNISILTEMNWFLKNAEMARVYGIQFYEVWTRGSQLRVESMILRLARKLNFVAPSVTHSQRNMMSAPEQLQLILEPQSKVYFDPVIVLDFQSLYPSMVIAHNYCYSTILGKLSNLQNLSEEGTNREEIVLGALKYLANKEDIVRLIAHKEVGASPLAALFVKKTAREGVLPIMLREILSARIIVKNAMKRVKSKKLKRILEARQLALKLVANVSYGYTAANWSGRMPCAELADAILGKGRETLEHAIDMVKNGNYGGAEVIYGDTDSMFVLVRGADLKRAFDIGKQIAADVTNANPDPVVLKLEKVYMGCVLETKKRYAGWMFEHENDEGKLDAKGIETVRRDTCPIVAEVLEKSLKLIFSKQWKAFSKYLNNMAIELPNQNFQKFMFCKEFRGDYSKRAMVPQKKIAEDRIKECPFYVTLRGERVPYVIVDGPPGSTVYSCVRSIDDFAKIESLKINVYYYLNSHILAALRRVTDLLPTKIVLLPLLANRCFTPKCSRLGQSPWCTDCQNNEEALIGAYVQLRKETKSKSYIREICAECQSCAHHLSDIEVSNCRNFSCLLRQAWAMMGRANTAHIINAHKLSKLK
ncbi:unnamed protein product [Caenorhabditis bovis]|uniref:DNA polymerase zeta catalytic subunit n=1 Tax=Caenorhabditis bovis TaxID=2654633 RepID=A0A8S1ETS0_9PELO|nr:unnamed protein product [Caenorhabditis bovis]